MRPHRAEPIAVHHVPYWRVPCLLLLLLLAACTSAPRAPSYSERYVQALETHDGVAVQSAHLEPFIEFITSLGSKDWKRKFQGVYAEQVHFSDTLALIEDRATLQSYFADLNAANAQVSVNVLSQQLRGQDGYLIWEMRSSFKPIFATKHSHSIGMTHLRFNAEGEIILQQDFWDAATGFYQHVPMLGQAVRGVNARLQP
ncbi:MAG: hypothetical protein ACR2PZ_01545 [Pseudomonadales bacterium]